MSKNETLNFISSENILQHYSKINEDTKYFTESKHHQDIFFIDIFRIQTNNPALNIQGYSNSVKENYESERTALPTE